MITPRISLVSLTTALFSVPLAAQIAWHQQTPATNPPMRAHCGMTYDAGRDRVVMFGGATDGGWTKLADTWEWNGTDWTRRFPANVPNGRNNMQIAYDAGRHRTVMFGGLAYVGSSPGAIGDTWEWDGDNWLQAQPAHAPSPRAAYALCNDPLRGKVVLFGGTLPGGQGYADTWEWDGSDWTQRFPAAHPGARFNPAMAFDAAGGHVVLFGGMDGSYTNLGDTWQWDGSNWTQRFPAVSPPARAEHTMTYDAARQRVVLFGGYFRNDTWEWNGLTWNQAPSLPGVRRGTSMAYEATRNRIVLFGGETSGGYLDDTWTYSANGSPATYTAFGQGCAGHFGVPVLGISSGQPILGTRMTLSCTSLPPDHFTTLWFGFSNTSWIGGSLPFDLGTLGMTYCTLYVSSDFVTSILNWGGTAHWSFTIPNDPQLRGARFYNQVGTIDRVNPLGMIVSNAAEARVGDF